LVVIIESTVAAMKICWLKAFCFSLVLCALIIGLADAVAQTFTVSAGHEVIKTMGLNEGDVVSGRLNVVGGSNDIRFHVTDPNGNVIVRFDQASATNFGFTVSRTGTYSLHFDNTLSDSDKTVTINYDVQHYILGMPQEFFYVFVVLFIGILGVMVFIAIAHAQ